MPSPSSLSPDERDGLLRRFLVASRRGEIVALINSVRLEDDLGPVVATELCEAYDAEIGFMVIARPGSTTAELIGCVGLIGDDPTTILAQPLCREALSGAVAVTERGTDLLELGIRHLALGSPHGGRRPVARRCRPTLRPALRRVGAGAARGGHQERRSGARAFRSRASAPAGPRDGERRAPAGPAAGPLDVNAVEPQAPAELPRPLLPQLGSLADLFRLLGHPVRLRILLALGSDTLSPSELEQRLDVSLGVIAYHVGVLRDDGLLMLVDTRPARGALESFYRLTGRGELARKRPRRHVARDRRHRGAPMTAAREAAPFEPGQPIPPAATAKPMSRARSAGQRSDWWVGAGSRPPAAVVFEWSEV